MYELAFFWFIKFFKGNNHREKSFSMLKELESLEILNVENVSLIYKIEMKSLFHYATNELLLLLILSMTLSVNHKLRVLIDHIYRQ